MQNKKLNWWAIIAVLIIGIPVGFVTTGVIKKAFIVPEKEVEKDSFVIIDSTKIKGLNDSIFDDSISLPNVDCDTIKTIDDYSGKKSQKTKEVIKEEIVDDVLTQKPVSNNLYVSVKPKNLSYTSTGGTQKITINSNTDWKIIVKGNDEWLTTNTTDGNSNKTITIMAQENKAVSPRYATIEVIWTDQNNHEQTYQLKASQASYVPIPEPVSIVEAQSIVAEGKASDRIPDRCKITGKKVNTNYGSFRYDVQNGKYQKVTVISVDADKKSGNATKIVVNVESKSVPKDDPEPIITKPVLSHEEARAIISSGKTSNIISDGCKIILNGRPTNYQNFRNGVKLGSYSGIKVTKIDDDGKTINAVYVTAKVISGDD